MSPHCYSISWNYLLYLLFRVRLFSLKLIFNLSFHGLVLILIFTTLWSEKDVLIIYALMYLIVKFLCPSTMLANLWNMFWRGASPFPLSMWTWGHFSYYWLLCQAAQWECFLLILLSGLRQGAYMWHEGCNLGTSFLFLAFLNPYLQSWNQYCVLVPKQKES